MDQIFQLYPTTPIQREHTYVRSYPALLRILQPQAQSADPDVFVVIAHAVYGWMPTVLTMHGSEDQLGLAAWWLREAGQRRLAASELEDVARAINHSVVGASKALHFANPELYPIWDSKVYRFLHQGTPQEAPHQNRVNNVGAYLDYQSRMLELTHHPEAGSLRAHVSAQCGYEVSTVRAMEMVMFLNAPR